MTDLNALNLKKKFILLCKQREKTFFFNIKNL